MIADHPAVRPTAPSGKRPAAVHWDQDERVPVAGARGHAPSSGTGTAPTPVAVLAEGVGDLTVLKQPPVYGSEGVQWRLGLPVALACRIPRHRGGQLAGYAQHALPSVPAVRPARVLGQRDPLGVLLVGHALDVCEGLPGSSPVTPRPCGAHSNASLVPSPARADVDACW
ncbi:hypothetical protein AB0B21_35055 [Streptomyces rimosus]|uniref:hypothetical protein n=1 Tax=Streptomyces rimosus TaxID=1927 RepID=UPI00131B8CE7|nr:hypothetical protein [Streptomyces rimosus]